MNPSITYRKLPAVILMVLYAFICTPAQIWHSHSHTASIPANVPEDGNGQENALISADNMDGVCSICAHHYSAYTDNTPEISETFTLSNGIPAGEYVCSFPNTPKPGFCNKGPPYQC